jgi:hypothetical protein
MRDLTDVRIRRGLLVLAAVSVCVALAGPVHAKEEKITFLPGTDVSSWYWERQQDQEVTTPPGIPPPFPTCVPAPPPVGTTCNAPPVSSRARGPHPYRPDTLPVTHYQGTPERKAAIKFDLLERGVTEGSKIKELLLFIEESTDRNEPPQASPEKAKIQACRILQFISQGENEQFKDAPKHDDKDCVEGTREASTAGAPAVWTFDLTKMADAWGKNPFDNYGVMLVGTGTDTWEVHLKIPRKDNPNPNPTTVPPPPDQPGDDYELTKHRAFVKIDFIPGEPIELEVPDVPAAPAPSSSGTSTVPSSSGAVIPPSTDFTGTEDVPGTDTGPPAPAPTEQAGFLALPETGPRMPAYVWLAIPLGLLALSAVRSVVLEPVGGPRPDGVIAAIRRRNAQRRGGSLAVRQGALGRMTEGIKRGFAGIGSGFSSVTRSLRRKR